MTRYHMRQRRNEEARGKWKKPGWWGSIEKNNVLSSHEALMKTEYITVHHLDKLLQ